MISKVAKDYIALAGLRAIDAFVITHNILWRVIDHLRSSRFSHISSITEKYVHHEKPRHDTATVAVSVLLVRRVWFYLSSFRSSPVDFCFSMILRCKNVGSDNAGYRLIEE